MLWLPSSPLAFGTLAFFTLQGELPAVLASQIYDETKLRACVTPLNPLIG